MFSAKRLSAKGASRPRAPCVAWSGPVPGQQRTSFCKLIKRTPGTLAKALKQASGIDRQRCERLPRIPLPGNADFEPGQAAEPLSPALDQLVGRKHVGYVRGDRFQRRAEDPRQAHQRGVDIELRQGLALGHPLVDAGAPRKQRQQRLGAFQHHAPHALAGPKARSARSGSYRPGPARRAAEWSCRFGLGLPIAAGRTALGKLLGLPSPLVFGPAVLEVAAEQPEQGAIPMGHRVVRFATARRARSRLRPRPGSPGCSKAWARLLWHSASRRA